MSDTQTREELDAKLGRISAETDTKIARLDGKMDLMLSKLDAVSGSIAEVRNDNRATRANQWVIGLGLAVLIVAVAGIFPVFFGMGAQIRDMVHTEIQQSLPAAPVPKP